MQLTKRQRQILREIVRSTRTREWATRSNLNVAGRKASAREIKAIMAKLEGRLECRTVTAGTSYAAIAPFGRSDMGYTTRTQYEMQVRPVKNS